MPGNKNRSHEDELEQGIVDTVRHPVLVLHDDLRVKMANPVFYAGFQVKPEETVGRLIYELGNEQWDIPQLRELLEKILPEETFFNDFEVEHDFEQIGHKVMLLNARRLDHLHLILLAIEDITEQRRAARERDDTNRDLEQRIVEAEQQADRLRALAIELTDSQQNERRRLAHVLHDQLQQLLVAAMMSISQAQARVVDVAAVKSLERAGQLLEQSLAESLSLVTELSPTVLYDAGLVPALQWLGEHVEESHGLKMDLDAEEVEAEGMIPDNLRAFLFQSVRELLLNVMKHAEVDRVRVIVTRSEADGLTLVVEDKGRGCDPEQLLTSSPTSFGLFNIRQRLQSLGGSFEVESGPAGEGCSVRLVVPSSQLAGE